MSAEVTIGSVTFSSPYSNGGGLCKSEKDADWLLPLNMGAIEDGSTTVEGGDGNKPGTVLYQHPTRLFTGNTLGMPNRGLQQSQQVWPTLRRRCDDLDIRLILNVAPFSPREAAALTYVARRWGHVVHINGGCPNTDHPIMTFDPDSVEATLDAITESVGVDAQIWLKLSPIVYAPEFYQYLRVYFPELDLSQTLLPDPDTLAKVAEIINRHSVVKAVTSINTVPRVLITENGKPVITFGNGTAGLGGRVLRQLCLKQVRELAGLLNPTIAQVQCGGVHSGQDILDGQQAGAVFHQVTSEILMTAGHCMPRIMADAVRLGAHD